MRQWSLPERCLYNTAGSHTVPAAHPGGLAITVTKISTIVTPTHVSTVHAPTQGPSAIPVPVQMDFRVQTVTNVKQVKDSTVRSAWTVSGRISTTSRLTLRRVRRKHVLKGLVSRRTVVGNPTAATANNAPPDLSHRLDRSMHKQKRLFQIL